MELSNNKGILVTLEGGEGSGKSTQALRIQQYVADHGYRVFLTKEPRGYYREQIFALSRNDPDWRIKELQLFLEDRRAHFLKEIIPALKNGVIVVSDRCGDSTVAYQGHARGIEHPHVLRALNEEAMHGIIPHFTILFDIDPRVAMKRVENRGEEKTRFEKEAFSFHDAVWQGFLIEAEQNNPERWLIIGATQDCDAITAHIIAEFERRFGI